MHLKAPIFRNLACSPSRTLPRNLLRNHPRGPEPSRTLHGTCSRTTHEDRNLPEPCPEPCSLPTELPEPAPLPNLRAPGPAPEPLLEPFRTFRNLAYIWAEDPISFRCWGKEPSNKPRKIIVDRPNSAGINSRVTPVFTR